MRAGTDPRYRGEAVRLLSVDTAAEAIAATTIGALPGLLAPGDVVVVNDAATLPASLPARTEAGDPLELRLVEPRGDGRWLAVLFGAGDWRTDTDARPAPPPLSPGDRLRVGGGGELALTATVVEPSPLSPRLVTLAFDRRGGQLWAALYRLGRPVQYAYQPAALPLAAVQTGFAGRPWAAEMPSAGRPLSASVLASLRRAGVGVAALTHAAGLSATGDPELDRALPLPERYDIPAATVAAIERARAAGGRVVAVGTTVVRALEGCVAERGGLRAGPGRTALVLSAATRPRLVDAVISGVHPPGESHFRLLCAFAAEALLARAWARAEAAGFVRHELGDAVLVGRHLGGARRSRVVNAAEKRYQGRG